MLINLPKSMICSMIGRELMKYGIQEQDDTNPDIFAYMGDIDPETGTISVKYLTLTGTEPFMKYFVKARDNYYTIPREVVSKFYNTASNLTPDVIIEYAKLITAINIFMAENPCAIGSYQPPIHIVQDKDEQETEEVTDQ